MFPALFGSTDPVKQQVFDTVQGCDIICKKLQQKQIVHPHQRGGVVS